MGCIRQVLGTLQRQFFCADELTKETAVNLKHVYESNRACRYIHGFLPIYYLVYGANNTHIHRGRGQTIHYVQDSHPQAGPTSTGWFSAYIRLSIRRKQHPHPQGEGGKPYTTYRTHIHRRDPHPQGGRGNHTIPAAPTSTGGEWHGNSDLA